MRIPERLPPQQRTLPALLERGRAGHPDRVLVLTETSRLTYAEALERAATRGGALAAAGVGAGDRVAVMSENRLEVIELWLGCAWIGAVLVPINTAFRGPQLAHVLGDARAKLLVVEPELVQHLQHVATPSVPRWVFDETFPAPAEPAERAAVGPSDPSMILYTSGTTGPSKGVVCPQAQWYWWGSKTGEALGVVEEDVLYTNLPLFHTNALNTFVQALVFGATFALGPRFSASQFWRRLVEAEATVTYLLGPMVHILTKRDPDPLEQAHRVRIALAPATPAALYEPFRQRFGIRLVDGWGSTETNVVISTAREGAPPGSMGAITPGFDARVVDENDDEVPPGRPGELVVRSDEPYAFALEYNQLPDTTVETWRNLWFHTGDRVVRDESGWFWFVDRLKDSIRRRGENISSYEVEAVLTAHEDVAAAAVVPVPAEVGGDEVLAFVVLRDGAAPTPEDLIAFCEPRLAYFAIPRYVEFLDAFPLTSSGKVEKYKLRERGVTGSAWDRERAGYVLRR
ncbi:MAG TPA: ATP-dependent acyl-CoA ligase [Gaiellaceae bacterium]|nr:ATP-dependent acyl-CoA ligase [Gaiellaceae bacterium]